MNKLGKFALLHSKSDWEQACIELASEISQVRNLPSFALNASRQPEDYPCLAAAVLLPVDASQPNTVDTIAVMYSFVYRDEALRLIEACRSSELEADLDSIRLPETSRERTTTVPNPLASLLLAVVAELKAVGVLKEEKLLEAMAHSNEWLAENQSENNTDSTINVVKRFWSTI